MLVSTFVQGMGNFTYFMVCNKLIADTAAQKLLCKSFSLVPCLYKPISHNITFYFLNTSSSYEIE
jgi:hypothetical protein